MTDIQYPIQWSEIPKVYPFSQTLIFTSIFINLIFFTVYFTKVFQTQKQLSWFITFISSSVLTLSSLPFIYELIQNPFDLKRFAYPNQFSIILSSFFIATLTWDLILGAVFYPKYLDPVTGWIHHTAYIIILLAFTKHGFCQFYCIMCPMEAPTVLLSLGSMNKKFRKDWLFGTVFFITRIVYHFYSIITWYVYFGDLLLEGVIVSLYPMHCIWFKGFVNQQIRLFKKKKAGQEGEQATTTGQSSKDPLLSGFNGVSSGIETSVKDYGLKDRSPSNK